MRGSDTWYLPRLEARLICHASASVKGASSDSANGLDEEAGEGTQWDEALVVPAYLPTMIQGTFSLCQEPHWFLCQIGENMRSFPNCERI